MLLRGPLNVWPGWMGPCPMPRAGGGEGRGQGSCSRLGEVMCLTGEGRVWGEATSWDEFVVIGHMWKNYNFPHFNSIFFFKNTSLFFLLRGYCNKL